ncbi:S1 RNA-binding domain-containing protein [Vibrio sp. D431a]|uniref:S1 RNA-binding domain-containing protein n=1 Tax=Vibrio sp. D431a TaxID=2837388 RepID=UPI002556A9E0|nr:S1 RNA-binding domain-containing protein [Vibrio sp. D431a]MDK9793240.1 S1 RNA-binding domain-containing protein [Vibrio sp. D431a]
MKNTESFAQLLEESAAAFTFKTNEIVKATVLGSDRHYVTVDAGLPMEANIPSGEFFELPRVNDEVSVIVFAFDDGTGQPAISHHRALQIESSELVEDAIVNKSVIQAKVVKSTRAGLLVRVGALDGFIPNTLIDTVRIDKETLIGQMISVVPLSIDEKNRNVVVSRKEALITERGGRIEAMEGELAVGDVREGVIKNIVRYGAFVDLGGKDCMIHVSDMGWDVTKANPAQDLEIGQRVKGLINKVNAKGQFHMSLRHADMKPWEDAKAALTIGQKVSAEVVKIEDDYSIITVVNGVPAVVAKNQVSWTHIKGYDLFQTYASGTKFEAIVTGFNETHGEECVMLSIKQTKVNPWEEAKDTIAEGKLVTSEVKSVNEGHIIVSITDEISALVPFRELSWGDCQQAIRDIHAGDEIDVVILQVEPDEHRVVASIRATQENPFAGLRKGSTVKGEVTGFNKKGNMVFIDIKQGDKVIKGFVSSRHALPTKSVSMRADEYYSIGDNVKGTVLGMDGDRVQVNLRKQETQALKAALGCGDSQNNAMLEAMKAAKKA